MTTRLKTTNAVNTKTPTQRQVRHSNKIPEGNADSLKA